MPFHPCKCADLAFFWLVCLVVFRPAPAMAQTAKVDRPPNILIVFVDDMGYADLGCFGAKGHETPHLDRMAKEGTRFTDFYVAQPVCSASRTALLTGCYPNRIGILGALNPKSRHGISDQEITIAQLLKPRLRRRHLRQMAPRPPAQIPPHPPRLRRLFRPSILQ